MYINYIYNVRVAVAPRIGNVIYLYEVSFWGSGVIKGMEIDYNGRATINTSVRRIQ